MTNKSYPFPMHRGFVVLGFLASWIFVACSIADGDRPIPTPAETTDISETRVVPGQQKQPPAPPATPAPQKTIYLQPIGRQLSNDATVLVERAIVEFYGLQVKRAAPLPLPRSAYYPPRKRYRAEKLLDFLEHRLPADAYRILGITAVDISTTKGRHRDWGIMGLATLDGRVSVMSMFRCRRGSRSRQHARERLGKVAVHELGHTFGLEHCPTHGCLMEDARGTNTTTDREYVLCPRCRQFLTKRGFNLPANPNPPWPRP